MTPWTVTLQTPLSIGFSSKNTGVGCHCLLQGIFLSEGSKLGLLHFGWMPSRLSCQGSPKVMVGRRELFLDMGIVSPLFTCSGWGGHQELGLKIDLFKPLSLLSSPQRLEARGQPGVWACPGSVGASAVPAGGLPWGVGPARSPRPVPACWPCRPVTAAGPALGLFSAQVCAGCLRAPSSFARQSKESFVFGNEASSLTDPRTSALLPAKLYLFFLPLCLVIRLPQPRSRGSAGAASPHGPSPCSSAGQRGP